MVVVFTNLFSSFLEWMYNFKFLNILYKKKSEEV